MGCTSQLSILCNLLRRICKAAVVPDNALQCLRRYIPALNNVKLAPTAPPLRVDLVTLTGSSKGSLHVNKGRIDFSLNPPRPLPLGV